MKDEKKLRPAAEADARMVARSMSPSDRVAAASFRNREEALDARCAWACRLGTPGLLSGDESFQALTSVVLPETREADALAAAKAAAESRALIEELNAEQRALAEFVGPRRPVYNGGEGYYEEGENFGW